MTFQDLRNDGFTFTNKDDRSLLQYAVAVVAERFGEEY